MTRRPINSTTLRSRADLLRAVRGRPEDEDLVIANRLGFEERPPAPDSESSLLSLPGFDVSKEKSTVDSGPSSEGYPENVEDIAIWVPTHFRSLVDGPEKKPEVKKSDYLVWNNPPKVRPQQALLSPWSVLLPRIRRLLGGQQRGNRIDVPRLVHKIADQQVVKRLPRHRRRTWNHPLVVVRDESLHLAPYFADQSYVLDQLVRLVPEHLLTHLMGQSPDDLFCRLGGTAARYVNQQPVPGTRILILGDLGVLDQSRQAMKPWLTWLKEQKAKGCELTCLFPGPKSRVPENIRRIVSIESWQRDRFASIRDSALRKRAIGTLLTLAAPTVRLEPGLLRDLRRLKPELSDATLESEFWQHPNLASRHFMAAAIDPRETNEELLPAFERLPKSLRKKVLTHIRLWRTWLLHAPEVWFREYWNLSESSRALISEDREDAEAGLRYICRLAIQERADFGLKSFAGRVAGYASDSGLSHPVTGELVRELRAKLHPEKGVHHTAAADEREPFGELRTLQIQAADRQISMSQAMPGHDQVAPAPIRISTMNDLLQVEGHPSPINLPTVARPEFATDFDHDEVGPWCELQIPKQGNQGHIVQRFRWIPAGEFMMGSPDDERGRDTDEVQHLVRLTSGFWMADTACPQSLWSAVMDDNPSHFKGENLPVEQISYEDAIQFLDRLNRMVSGGGFRLPTEAEWEYSCRAGTQTPFSFGETIDTQQVNFNGSYRYLETEAAEDYRRKTVPVMSLPCNRWGLYEMHGNVWEWCHDRFGDYKKGLVKDPSGAENGSDRVVRGGSLIYNASHTRSAYRNRYSPGDRYYFLGFRFLSSAKPVSNE